MALSHGVAEQSWPTLQEHKKVETVARLYFIELNVPE